MAKSIRSKRKQKVKAASREKYREREKEKLWEKHLAIQAQRTVDMADVEGGIQKLILIVNCGGIMILYRDLG